MLALGDPVGLPNLGKDLRLPEHHGIEPRRHREEMQGSVVLVVRIEGFRELVRRDLTGFRQEALHVEEARVIGSDLAEDLYAVARGEDDPFRDGLHVEEPPIRFREVLVGEGQSLEQLDRCPAVRDSQGEDGHQGLPLVGPVIPPTVPRPGPKRRRGPP